MKRTKFIFALLLGLANVSFAYPAPTVPLTNFNGQTNCALLPSPASLDVFSVSPTSITYTWPTVPGAVSYYLETKDVATGNVVDVQTVSAALVPKATVANLTPNTVYQTSIQSVDNNGVLSEPATLGMPLPTPIFELVASFYPTTNITGLNCVMGYTPETGGSYTTDGTFTYYKVVYSVTQEFKIFKVNVISPPRTAVWTNPLPGTNITFSLSNGGANAIINYIGKPAVTLTTTLNTSPSVIRLFRDPNGVNDPAFIVYYMGCIPPLQDPGSDDRMIDSDGSSVGLGLSASPNPFSNELDITLPFSNETQDINLSLYDLQGRQVLTQSIPGGTQMLKLSTEHIAPGLYFLRAQSGDMSEIIRVLKTQ